MKFKKIIILTIGLIVEFMVHEWICKNSILTKNYGISFSLDWVNSLYLNIIFVLIIGGLFWKEKSYFLILILIGGLVNMSDRLTLGYVRDYWKVGDLITNNLNDWLISIGAFLFLIKNVWKK